MFPLRSPVPLSKLARRFDVHVSTVHRWRLNGVSGVRLACVKIGGRWFSTEDALSGFLAALNGEAGAQTAPSPAKVKSETAQVAEAAALEQRLIARGL